MVALPPKAGAGTAPLRPLYLCAGLALALGLAISPFIYHWFDMTCWLTWQQATAGARPWDIYLRRHDCNYPALLPYWLTAAEFIRLHAHAPVVGRLSVFLIKLPSLLAVAAGAPLCAYGLRPQFGRASTASAVLYVLCVPLLLDAAVWGQWDAPLCLMVTAAVVAALNGRAALAGVALGVALSIKPQGIVVLPALAVYLWRRGGGVRAWVTGGLACVLTAALLALPYLAHGAGRGLLWAYTGAVDFVPVRSCGAYNPWFLLEQFDVHVRHMPGLTGRLDTTRIVGPVTDKDLGLVLLAGYTIFLLATLWRHPRPSVFIWAAALNAFAFYMLPTQMHERYILPALPLLALIAPRSRDARLLFWALCVTISLNLALVFDLEYQPALRAGVALQHHLLAWHLNSLAAVANTALFLWASRVFWRDARASGDTAIASGAGQDSAGRPANRAFGPALLRVSRSG